MHHVVVVEIRQSNKNGRSALARGQRQTSVDKSTIAWHVFGLHAMPSHQRSHRIPHPIDPINFEAELNGSSRAVRTSVHTTVVILLIR